ncbi:hypothetical protein AAC387_Pa11g0358 [Persea americana]
MATRGVDDGSQGKDFHEMEGSEGLRNTIFVEFVSSMKIRDLESEVSNMASSSHPISIQASHDLLSTSNIEPAVTGDVGFELSTIPPETSKTPKRCPTMKIAEERAEWLPEGWTMEARERTSMKWKGVRDRQSTLRFDFKNPPAKVSWVLSNFAEGVWTPYINNEEVSESTRKSWVTAMEGINNSANQFQE